MRKKLASVEHLFNEDRKRIKKLLLICSVSSKVSFFMILFFVVSSVSFFIGYSLPNIVPILGLYERTIGMVSMLSCFVTFATLLIKGYLIDFTMNEVSRLNVEIVEFRHLKERV